MRHDIRLAIVQLLSQARSSHTHQNFYIMGVAKWCAELNARACTCALSHQCNMAALLEALSACFWWYIDVIICFLVSTSILAFTGLALFFLYRRFAQPVTKDDEAMKRIAKRYEELNNTSRAVLFSSPFVIFGLALLWRVWDIVVNNSTQIQCEGEEAAEDEEAGVQMLSSIMPTWFLPFWIYRDYEVHVAVVPLRLTKLLFISALLLSIPLVLTAFHYMSKSNEPILTLARWLIKMYQKWSDAPCGNHLHRIIQLEWAEEQYMKTIIQATVACMEKEGEVKQLQVRVKQLENSIMEVNQWVNSERRLTNCFDKKNREMKKLLQSEKRRSQCLEGRCADLLRELEDERRASVFMERKIQQQHRRLADMEKRPYIVKQHISGDDILCVICMERKRQYLLRPCNHYCVCNVCKSTLQNKCPLCRKLIRSYEKIYIS